MKLNDPELVRGEVPIQELLKASMPPAPQAAQAPVACCPKCRVPTYFDVLTNFKAENAAEQQKASQLLNWYISFHREFEKLLAEHNTLALPGLEQEYEAEKDRFRELDAKIADKENEKSDHRLSAQRRKNLIDVASAEVFGARQRLAQSRANFAPAAVIKKAEAELRKLQKKRDALQASPDPLMYYNDLENNVIPKLKKERAEAENRANELAHELGIVQARHLITNEFGIHV